MTAPYVWAIAAILLAGVELHAPGAYFIWLAAAAAGTAGLAVVLPSAPEWQVVHFVLLGVVAVLVGRQLFGYHSVRAAHPRLNNRAAALVGTTVTVVEPLTGGSGRVQLGDSPWSARGPDMAVGSLARVVRVDGTTLVVDQA